MPFSVFLNACLGAILVGGVSAYLVYVLGARLLGEDRIPMMVLIAVAAGSASITFLGLFTMFLVGAGGGP